MAILARGDRTPPVEMQWWATESVRKGRVYRRRGEASATRRNTHPSLNRVVVFLAAEGPEILLLPLVRPEVSYTQSYDKRHFVYTLPEERLPPTAQRHQSAQ